MKEILFYYSQLNIGGAEKSLIRLMNALVLKRVHVTLILRYGGGTGEYLLDKKVDVIHVSNKTPLHNKTLPSIMRNVICLIQRIISTIKLKSSRKRYDIAFIGLQGLSPSLVLNNIHVSKVAWFIRSDISLAKKKERIVNTIKSFQQSIDYFVCVADTVRESLIREVPEVKDKAIVRYNILDVEEMKKNIQIAPNPFTNEACDVFRIVSVCRISDASKGVFRMADVCKKLKEDGYKFKWYIVGDGPDLPQLKTHIQKCGLSEVMITPGRVDNPFGYYRDCDLVAMLSYYEGLCGVVNEAKVVGKPIIATIVSGVKEQLTHGVNGWIVDNNETSIYEGLKLLLSDNVKLNNITNDIYPDAILNDERKIKEILKLTE